jgi:predicted metal-dependent peptidase
MPTAATPRPADPGPRHPGRAADRASRALRHLVEYAPASGGLALWVAHAEHPAPQPGEAPVTTDGRTLFYAPAFNALGVEQQAGCIARAVLHVALRHAQRRDALGDADPALFEVCAAALVDGALAPHGWLRLAPGAVTLDRLLEQTLGPQPDGEDALAAWDVERLYRALDDRRPRPSGGDPRREDGPRAAQARALGRGAPRVLRPCDGSTHETPEAEADTAATWQDRLLRADAADGDGSLVRALLHDARPPRTPWRQLLRTRLARGLADAPGPSSSRPTRSYIANQGRGPGGRRLPWDPAQGGPLRVPRLALAVDVSASVDRPLLAAFAAEVDAIARLQRAEMVVVIGDDRVRRVLRFPPGRPALADAVFDGGGGTDFAPLLAEADRHRPDLVVVFTDGQGPAGPPPRAPVLWALPAAQADAPLPFGRRLVLG